jgi:Bifunctional DNA primase/polymerase, N-terminal
MYPGELVGVATGTPSQIAVIDLDKKHPEAMSWFHAHIDDLPRTRIHFTRSGGLHLIYGHYDGLRCSTLNIPPMRQADGKPIPGVEVKADGGCCTWWPAAGYPPLQDAPIAPWPDFLVPELPKPREPRPAELKGDLDYALRRADGLIRTVATAPNGERNRVLYWAGCCLAEMVADHDIDGPACRDVYEALVRAAVHRGLDRREAVTTLRSAAQKRAA